MTDDLIRDAAEQLPQLPPSVKLMNYPAVFGIAGIVVFTGIILFLTGRFDPTQGPLTVSLLIVLTFIGAVIFCMLFSIPNDEITAAVIGGLVAAFGAVTSYWLTKK